MKIIGGKFTIQLVNHHILLQLQLCTMTQLNQCMFCYQLASQLIQFPLLLMSQLASQLATSLPMHGHFLTYRLILCYSMVSWYCKVSYQKLTCHSYLLIINYLPICTYQINPQLPTQLCTQTCVLCTLPCPKIKSSLTSLQLQPAIATQLSVCTAM